MRKSIYIYSAAALFTFISCKEERVSQPRPHSYPRIDFPERSYSTFNEDFCPVTFDYPSKSDINKKQFFFNEDPEHDCWFNINLTDLNATLYFTYQPLNDPSDLEVLVDDSFTMVSKHNSKANSREENRISNAEGLEGVLFEMGGPVASPIQYYLTDNKNHFMRASMYFNESSANDSLQIVTDYIKEDILHMIGTTSFAKI